MEKRILAVLLLWLFFTVSDSNAQRKIPKDNQRSSSESLAFKNYTHSDTLKAIHIYYAEMRENILTQSIISTAGFGLTAFAGSESYPSAFIPLIMAVPVSIYFIRKSRYTPGKEEEEVSRYEMTGELKKRTRRKLHKFLR